MKCILFFLLIFNLIGCSSNEQKKNNRLIIDGKLSNEFFERSVVVHNDPTKTYIDSVFVYSDSTQGEELHNAAINEKNQKRHPYNVCRSYFSRDTLFVEFRNAIKDFFSDEFDIKVIKEEYYISFLQPTKNKSVLIPEYLKFKNLINKKGQEILGELAFTLQDKNGIILYSYQGPFKCIVE